MSELLQKPHLELVLQQDNMVADRLADSLLLHFILLLLPIDPFQALFWDPVHQSHIQPPPSRLLYVSSTPTAQTHRSDFTQARL